jgi:ATP-binding cassette, subfamily C (CFTR/MRP), member 1
MAAARHLFDRVIGPHGLLATRARLLVTHAISFVPQCDHIIFVRDGRITEQGSYLGLMGAGSDLSQLLSEHGARKEASSSEHSDGEHDEALDGDVGCSDPDTTTDTTTAGHPRRGSVTSIGRASLVGVPERGGDGGGGGGAKEQDRGVQSLMTEEKSASGRVAWDVYKTYIKAMSVGGAAATGCLILLAASSNIGKHRLAPHTGLAAVSLGGSHSVDRTQG